VSINLQQFHISSANICRIAVALAAIQLSGCRTPEERAESYYEHGLQLLAAHDNQRAEIEFLNAVRYNKTMLPAWRSLAQVEELTHNWNRLVPALHNIVELEPNDLSARIKLAQILLIAGDGHQALQTVNDAKPADSQNVNLLALKAAILFKLNDVSGAVRLAQAALKLDPANTGAMFVLAGDRFASGDAKGALEILDNETMNRSTDIGVPLFKLRIFEQNHDLQQAEALLHQLIQEHPKDIRFKKELIRLYVFQHRDDDAEREQRAIVAADPTNTDSQLSLVRLLKVTKGAPAAEQELLTLIKAGGDTFTYQIALAQLDSAQGKFSESVAELKKLIGDASSPAHVLTAQLDLADLYFNQKQTDAAEALVSDVLNKDARNTSGLKLRAAIQMERGQFAGAIADLREALNDQPRASDLMLMLADAYERSGSADLAGKEFADAMRASEFDPAVSLNYVAFLQRHGSILDTEDVLVDLAGRWPRNAEILSRLAQLKLARQEWADAQQLAETLRNIGTNPTMADELLGEALAGQKRNDASIVAFQEAYAASPGLAQPMYDLVKDYVQTGKSSQAISFLQSVLKANPTNAEAYVLLGSVQVANKLTDQARQSFTMAIEKVPTNAAGYAALSDFYVSQNNSGEAVDVIRSGLKALPDSFVLHFALAGLLEKTGDYEGAISQYEILIGKDPNSAVVANNLASLLADYRTDKASFDRARALMENLRNSPLSQFKDTLGWVSYREGDYIAAVPLLEQAAAALPKVPLVHYHLGMTYAAIGQPGKASEQFKIALDQAPNQQLQDKIRVAIAKEGTHQAD
jgi:tetratricopeptide (TPR) repeat protein